MALLDVDRHMLVEIVILQKQIDKAIIDFSIYWDQIKDVRAKTEFLIQKKEITDDQLPRLRDQITRAMKVCNTKLAIISDAMSRQKALFNHMVSEIERNDTKKGKETNE